MNQQTLHIRVFQDLRFFIAFGFGSGLLPKAPGTWGTLVALPIYYLIAPYSTPVYLFIVGVLTFIGIVTAQHVTNELQQEDFSGIVIDEIVGLLLTLTALPPNLIWIFIGFLLFRLFDILKPPPIRWFDQHIHGGLGIMLDDILAAVPAFVLLQLLHLGLSL